MANKSVLLIGLGGTGSTIVKNVCGEIPETEKKKIVVHVFDTDVNEAEKVLKPQDRTIISNDLTVEKCLLKDYMKNSNVEKWFPTEFPTIMKTKFSDGAGQIRSISRLAYMDAIASGKLKTLEKKLQEFSQLDGNSENDDVRVMIVSSLAGGTGSGIFLQIALYVKDYFESRGKSVKIRGAFLLPDIFVRTGCISGSKINNVYANGYASLKELNAILKSTVGNKKEENINIQLSYKPGMIDEKVSLLPYEIIFLYDYENTDGKHLASFDHYLDQITKTVYLQLFSDIAGAIESDEINSLTDIVQKDGCARYASAGVSTLTYPYNDIVEYTACKLASEKMEENWLKLDKIYAHNQDDIENQKKQGIVTEPLKKYIKINEIFDNEVQNGNVFFKNLNRTLYIIDKEGELGEKKSKRFIREVEEKIKNDIENSKEYKTFESYTAPREENLNKNPDDMRTEVENFENHLDKFKKKTIENIGNNKSRILDNIMPLYSTDDNEIKKFKYQLAYWIVGEKDGEAMHPLASRYFLCDIKERLIHKIKEYNDDVESSYRNIEGYSTSFNNNRSASEVASEKANSKGFFGLFKKEYKVFGKDYNEKATQQYKRIKDYRDNKITLEVFEELLKDVDDLIENEEESFFRALKEIRIDLSLKANSLEKQHENKIDVSKVFVFGKSENKQKLYEDLIRNMNVDDILKNTYSEIFIEKYKEFAARKRREIKRKNISAKENYKNKILDTYKEKIENTEILDMNVIDALKAELNYEGYDYTLQKEQLEEKILGVKERAKPFMLNISSEEFKKWGLNPKVLENLSEEERQRLFGEKRDIIESPGFSKYEIIRYASILGLKAQEFKKFSSGNKQGLEAPGSYFEAYKDKIEMLKNNESTINPHLDKRWHLINYMPDINDNEAQKDKTLIIDGFINGLLFENIIERDKEGLKIWAFKDSNGNMTEIKSGERDIKAEYPNLLLGLGSNPFIVDEIEKMAASREERDFNIYSTQLERHTYIELAKEKAPNLIDILIKYITQTERSREEEAKDKAKEILNQFMETSKNYIGKYYSSAKHKTPTEVFSKFIYIILNNSSELKKNDKADFIIDLENTIEARVANELSAIGLRIEKDELKNLNFEDLVKFIKERN